MALVLYRSADACGTGHNVPAVLSDYTVMLWDSLSFHTITEPKYIKTNTKH
jgi:hypothetical protein